MMQVVSFIGLCLQVRVLWRQVDGAHPGQRKILIFLTVRVPATMMIWKTVKH